MFSERDQKRIKSLVQKLVGNEGVQETGYRLICNNILKCMHSASQKDLSTYLQTAIDDDIEFARLISAMTIHHTSWFREVQHYHFLEEYLIRHVNRFQSKLLTIHCAACSTGEEAWSLAMMIEHLKSIGLKIEYRVLATDIDPISVAAAIRCLYPLEQINKIPTKFHKFIQIYTKSRRFTIKPELRKRVRFQVGNLLSKSPLSKDPCHIIFCRNVLIYMSPEQIKFVVNKILNGLESDGLLVIGISEHFKIEGSGLHLLEHSICQKTPPGFVDKSTNAGYTLSKINASTQIQAMPHGVSAILVGASTGGFDALTALFKDIRRPSLFPPVIVVQHISAEYRISLAQRLADVIGLTFRKPSEYAQLKKGSLYMAHADYHLKLESLEQHLVLRLDHSPPEQGHKPCINKLFNSAATISGHNFVAMLLTGMGSDGASGLLQLRQSGSFTAVQDQFSSVVFGMPREAVNIQAACYMGNIKSLNQILKEIQILPSKPQWPY